MKKLLISTLVCLFVAGTTVAQQRPQYTQYALNNYLANPAVTGIEGYADLRLGYRTQWSGMAEAPRSFYASIHGSLNGGGYRGNSPKETKPSRYGFSRRSSYKRAIPHHGVGAVAQVDEAGLLRTSTLNVSYAYHQPLNKYLTLSSGISTGLTQFGIRSQDAIAFDPGDPYLNSSIRNAIKADLNLGFWLYSPDFYLGVSGAQLLPNSSDFEMNGTSTQPFMRQQAHFYATGGVRLQPTRDISFIPSVMVKITKSATPSVDVNARVLYAQRVWGGVSYRHNDAMAAMAGVNLSHLLDIGYSYDITTSALNQVSAGSHEVVVGFKLNNHRKVICPMWAW